MSASSTRRVRDVGGVWLVLVALGVAAAIAGAGLTGHGLAIGIAAGATWITLALFALSIYNLVVLLRGRGSVVWLPAQRLPDWLTRWLPLATFVAGLVLGRLFWP